MVDNINEDDSEAPPDTVSPVIKHVLGDNPATVVLVELILMLRCYF